ncbi:hypothetical protein AcV7_000207 [Taiwanofungus camphoratus]|nr:hypothetical protein AcV7_000207 [Antrodia cinnamomea]
MARHARKRQRTAKSAVEQNEAVQPLGSVVSLMDEDSKDDEERRLESILFGKAYLPSEGSGNNMPFVSDDEQEHETAGEELQNLLDADLFFVDDAVGQRSPLDFRTESPEGKSGEESFNKSRREDGREDDEDDREEEGSEGELEEEAPKEIPRPSTSAVSKSKAPAWVDPDDTALQVSLTADKRLRKLRDAPSDDVVGGRDYERRLRRQFEKINPTPDWAANARKKLRPTKAKRRRPSSSSVSDEDETEALPGLLSDTASILTKGKAKVLPQGIIAIERLRDANLSARSEGNINAVQFHPSSRVPILLTASSDRRLRLFNVDGHTNPHLQTVHLPSLPLSTALFHPGGASVLLTGPRPFYYVYDLQSGTAQRSPRGLWGTTFANTNSGAQDASMEICAFDSSGSVLAVAGRCGHVHLVDWRAGQGQVIGDVKMNTRVKSLWWSGSTLMSLGEDAEVYVWDVGARRCVKRWKDDGGFGSRIVSGDRAGRYLAIGSRTGLVNLYGADGASSFGTERPKPLKTIGNLTTTISSMRFNHDSQLLAIASNTKKDQMRMIHLPSLTAFSNWPTSGTPLGHVSSIDFSNGSDYVAIGNNKGRVLLYHLKDFATS